MMNRIYEGVFIIVLLTILAIPGLVQAGSVLQVSGVPGVSIWLDNELIGKTTREQNGLVVKGLQPGEYNARAAREGYVTAEEKLVIEENQTVEWHILLEKAVMEVEDTVARIETFMKKAGDFGTVELKSIPLNAEVFFNGKPIGRTDLKLTYVPAAEHSVKFVFKQQELSEKFSLKTGAAVLLTADFSAGKISGEAGKTESELGPAVIKMQMKTARARKPAAIFPHGMHQEMYDCKECHHGSDPAGNRIPYVEGMKVQHCVTCHNPEMQYEKLNNLMQVSHALCKGCHKKVVEESGTAGPIGKCSGCHTESANK